MKKIILIRYLYNLIFKYIVEVILFFRDLIIFALFYRNRLKFNYNNRNAIIIGNGPSLNEFLKFHDLKNISNNYEIFVCNGFANTEFYTIIKPENYFLHDPTFFNLQSNDLNGQSETTNIWNSIYQNTKWPITIYTSKISENFKNNIESKYGKNKFITWKNLLPLKFYSSKNFFFYKKGLGLIGGMTVIHLAINIGILRHLKRLYLVGVDFNQFKNIEYDDENQKVYFNNEQFYNNNKIYYGEGVYNNFDLSDEMDCFSKSINGFKELKQFANYNNVKILRSTKSFLHFFDFKELPN